MSFPRAFGGGELAGDRLLRIVYLDESGTSRKSDEPNVYVAGVIVHGDHQLNNLRRELGRIVETHIPEQDREKPVLHACDIYGGNNYFDTDRKPEWTYDRRMAILADIAALPVKLNLKVVYGRVAKQESDGVTPKGSSVRVRERKDMLVGAAYTVCLLRVDHWFRRHAKGENCFIVVEDCDETRQFVKSVHKICQVPSIANFAPEIDSNLFPLRHIHEDPNFQEKRAAHPLVLADFIAYFIKRRDMGDSRSMQFSDPWMTVVVDS